MIFPRPALRLSIIAALALSVTNVADAGSATWKLNPTSGDWNTAANWNPQTIPNGAADTATFASSNLTNVSLSSNVELNGVTFTTDASPFTIVVASPSALTLSGVGITNASGKKQTFAAMAPVGATHDAEILFANSAAAGSGTVFVNSGPSFGEPGFGNKGFTEFADSSTAGNATFVNKAGGLTLFLGTSSAADGTFINKRNGGTNIGGNATASRGNFTIENGGHTFFFDSATAENGVFTVNDGSMSFRSNSTGGSGTFTLNGGIVFFENFSTAENATLTATDSLTGRAGGAVRFTQHSSGGTARVAIFGTGELDIRPHTANVEVGSIEGTGTILLGQHELTAGSNDLSTVFSGVIQDGGAGGSLTKTGTGKLTLTNANLYSGGTIVKRGKVLVNNTSGSGTGSGPVFVNGGALGGNGTIAGAVTVGNGSGRGAFLTPGPSATVTGRLTIQGALTFNSDATYKIQINSTTATTDKVLANSVTINTGAQFILEDLGSGTLPPGTVFTVINNLSANPIAGTFSNLPDGSSFTTNSNTFKASYEGGDGNDLTFTIQ